MENDKKPVKKKAGRKKGQHAIFDEQTRAAIKYMARAGLTDQEMADELHISKTSLENWKSKFKDFQAQLLDWKAEADEKVLHALCQRALGYDYEAEKPLVVSTGDFCQEIQIAHYKEHVPANVTAQIYWSKNRIKGWSDKQEVGVTDKDGNDRNFTISFADPDSKKDKEDVE
jgi:hypothetical protein